MVGETGMGRREGGREGELIRCGKRKNRSGWGGEVESGAELRGAIEMLLRADELGREPCEMGPASEVLGLGLRLGLGIGLGLAVCCDTT